MSEALSTRERLINAACRLTRIKGFDRVSTAEILDEAGVRRGSMYYFFPGKDVLGLAVLDRERAEFMQRLDNTLGAPVAPEEALNLFFQMALRKHRTIGFVGGCLWGNTALEMSDTNQAFTQVVAKVFDEWVARMTSVVDAGQTTGVFRSDQPADDLARMIVAAVEGGIMMSRLDKCDKPLKSCLETARRCVMVDGGSVC